MASGDRLSVSDGGQTSPSSPAPTTNRRAIAVRHSLTRRCRVRSCPPAEWHRRLVLQPLEQRLGRRIGLLVEPLLNPRPDGFNWVLASAIASWPAGSLVMGRPHFTIAPHRRKTGDETAQLRGGASRFGVGDTDFQLREHALCFSNFPQQSHRVQCRRSCSLHSSETSFRSKRRSHGVAGGWYFLITFAPSRVFEINLRKAGRSLRIAARRRTVCLTPLPSARPPAFHSPPFAGSPRRSSVQSTLDHFSCTRDIW